jgi:hypothetical protein
VIEIKIVSLGLAQAVIEIKIVSLGLAQAVRLKSKLIMGNGTGCAIEIKIDYGEWHRLCD